MIELKEIYCAYSKIKALRNINLNIAKGEAVAFIGPNGSGKSTLMRIINGIMFADKGSYVFDGNEITSKKMNDPVFSKAFHKRIGFLFQNSDTQLFCTSVYDEIAFGPRQMGMTEEEINIRTSDSLKLLSIEELQDRTPYHLSGGEKRKTALASILVMNPDVLVLDEPMNGLDPKTKRFLSQLIIQLNRSGKTILCATHDFAYMEGVFNRAVVLSGEHTIIRDDEYKKVINDEEFLIHNNII
jgi:cobalt/nickel transport system ATP-binding protein